MILSEILAQVAQQSGAPRAETDAMGVTRLLINEKYLVHLRSSADDKYFYMYSKAGQLPQTSARGSLCEMLLEANLFGDETGKAMFSVHKETNTIILMKIFEAANTSFESYQHDFQLFINSLAHWKEKLASSSPAGTSSAPGQSVGESDVLHLMSQHNQRIFFA